MDALVRKKYTDDDLQRLRDFARDEGKCGSLQTHSGMPCQRHVSVGFTVCRKHGARAPQTVAKAERLLAVARMPAIEALLDILDQWEAETCETCGYPRRNDVEERRLIMQVSKLVLDRTGLGPRSTLEVRTPKDEGDLPIDDMTAEECSELQSLVTQLSGLKDRVRARLNATPKTIIDVVAVVKPDAVSSRLIEAGAAGD